MYQEIIIAGFGGQGLMLTGKLLAYAAMREDYNVTWLPSYGPEMRGGTAHCTVIISTEKIPSPISNNPDALIVMNQPSLDKFHSIIKEEGTIYLNTSLIENVDIKSRVNLVKVPANKMASELGNIRAANMLILGSYLAQNSFIKLKTIKDALAIVLSNKKDSLISINIKAQEKGFSLNPNYTCV